MGRYPWRAGIKYYIARREAYLSSSTITEHRRKLVMIGKVLDELKKEGSVTVTDPRSISAGDIEGFLIYMKRKNLEITTREKYLSISASYLRFFGNPAIDQIRTEQGRILPPKPRKKIRSLTIEQMKAVFSALAGIEGQKGHILRGMSALAFCVGARPKEVMNAHMGDLDLERRTYYVRHPKGEEAYSRPQHVTLIRGDMIPILQDYMAFRSKQSGAYLFMNPDTGRPYSVNTIGRWYRELSEIVGFSVRLKDFRASLASITIEGDLSRMKAVSLQLRHTKISTTEHFYARIRDGEVEKEIGNIWQNNPIV